MIELSENFPLGWANEFQSNSICKTIQSIINLWKKCESVVSKRFTGLVYSSWVFWFEAHVAWVRTYYHHRNKEILNQTKHSEANIMGFLWKTRFCSFLNVSCLRFSPQKIPRNLQHKEKLNLFFFSIFL